MSEANEGEFVYRHEQRFTLMKRDSSYDFYVCLSIVNVHPINIMICIIQKKNKIK